MCDNDGKTRWINYTSMGWRIEFTPIENYDLSFKVTPNKEHSMSTASRGKQMSAIRIVIDTDNSAFFPNRATEVCRLLRGIADLYESRGIPSAMRLYDLNGNSVGVATATIRLATKNRSKVTPNKEHDNAVQ
jgi:hypothetical protein